jgi:hypothetical protein
MGTEGGRLHAHALVSESLAVRVLAAWDLGITSVSRFELCSESLRSAANYLSKDLDLMRAIRGQSYRIAKGFKPEALRLPAGLDAAALIKYSSNAMGSAPISIYQSPRYPVISARWDV